MSWRHVAVFGLALPLIIGDYLLSGGAAQADETPFIRFETPHLQKGRTLWMDNCRNCHGDGTAGAPIPMEADAWRPRLAKGKDVLYDHAINGFFGDEGTMMPERGGNPALSDDEVKAAVDYVMALARHYQTESKPAPSGSKP
ncbi:MAG: c-type cytochrome [bacterium]